MVYISHETSEQRSARLEAVLRATELKIFERPYAYIERSGPPGAAVIHPEALAWIRDEDSFSQLVPIDDPASAESFTLLCFHFPNDLDNSGFVGWLASRFKECLGTGVFVICGQNSARGGVYDYFGIPEALRTEVTKLIASWR